MKPRTVPRARRARRLIGVFVTLALAGVMAPIADAATSPPIKVIQNVSETPEPVSGISCNAGGIHTENHWLRRFDMDGAHGASDGFGVSSVVVAIESATSADGVIPGTIALWWIDPADPLQFANLNPIAMTPVNWDSVDDLSLLTVPLGGPVPPGMDLVIHAGVGPAEGEESFFLGANMDGESADDFIAAADCGVAEPTPVTDVGYPEVAHILFAYGKSNECMDAEKATAKAEKKLKKFKKKLKKAKKALKKAKKKDDAQKTKKFKKKVKKLKKKVKKFKKALKKARALQAEECAQPPLPTPPPPRQAPGATGSTGDRAPASPVPGFAFSTR